MSSAQESVSEDIGYNLLFESAPEEIEDMCITTSQPFPSYVTGDFVIPSIGLTEMGERKFVGFLDCFGKMQRFRIDGSKVSATYRMLASGFMNRSREDSTVGPGLLFFETEPPRDTPWPLGPISNLPPFAPNDNTYVNTIQLGRNLVSLTDSYTMLDLDPDSLKVMGTHEWKDDLWYFSLLASAHPMRHPRTGAWLDFVTNAPPWSETATIRLFSLDDQEPNVRRKISDVVMESVPYMHSFGVTKNYVILPRMPVKFSAQEVAMKPMATAFQPLELREEDPTNAFYIVPLDGSQHTVRTLPSNSPLFYVHTANAYENASGIVIDLTTTADNPFASPLTVEAAKSREQRNLGTAGSKNLVKRFFLPFSTKDPVTTEILSDPRASTDFPKINPKYQSKPHSFYWANEWFSGSDSYASMAVVKHNVHSVDTKLTWRREHWYPSEATMVPSDKEGAAEDDGVLIFTALDGVAGSTYLMCVNASTMETVSEVGPFPRIAFSTHGSFYPKRHSGS